MVITSKYSEYYISLLYKRLLHTSKARFSLSPFTVCSPFEGLYYYSPPMTYKKVPNIIIMIPWKTRQVLDI